MPNSTQRGLKTTEFYSCAAFASGCITVALAASDPATRIAALICGALTMAAYTISRAITKRNGA